MLSKRPGLRLNSFGAGSPSRPPAWSLSLCEWPGMGDGGWGALPPACLVGEGQGGDRDAAVLSTWWIPEVPP